jgi:hypothetical protein
MLLTSRRVVVDEVNEGRLVEDIVNEPERDSCFGGDNREVSSYKGVSCLVRLSVDVVPPNAYRVVVRGEGGGTGVLVFFNIRVLLHCQHNSLL